MKFKALGWLLAAALAGPGAVRAEVLSIGTQIAASTSGPATGLLSLDDGFSQSANPSQAGLAAADLEFLTDDFALAIDFLADGQLRLYDNTGTGSLAGSYTLSFDLLDLPGLGQGLVDLTLADLSGVTGGTLTGQLLGPHQFSLTLSNLSFDAPFGSLSVQLAVAPVPEPTLPALLLAAAMALAAARRRPRNAAA